MKKQLVTEYEYFINNKTRILKEYSGKFVVIKNEKIQAAFTSKPEALKYASTEFEMGTFIIQHAIDEKPIVQGFFARVSFA